MLTDKDLIQIMQRVSYPGWTFHIGGSLGDEAGGLCWLQGRFLADCNDSVGGAVVQKTRKWLLSRHMVTSEVVQTALKCVLTGIEHEARERFSYCGERIFGPHWDVDALVATARMRRVEVRK